MPERKGARIRQQAIQEAMRAGWAGKDADESNWLDQAAQAYPGPDAAVFALYGSRLDWLSAWFESRGNAPDMPRSPTLSSVHHPAYGLGASTGTRSTWL